MTGVSLSPQGPLAWAGGPKSFHQLEPLSFFLNKYIGPIDNLQLLNLLVSSPLLGKVVD